MNQPKIVTRDIFIHHSDYNEDNIKIFNCEMTEYGDVFLGKVSVTFEIPQIDVAAAKIEMLEKGIEKLQAETHLKVTNMKEQIQSLLAIGHCV